MDFSLTDDHRALRDAVARFAADQWPTANRGNAESGAQQRERHAALAGLGLLGVTLPEALGGSGLGATESMLVAQELGRVLAGGSWLASAAMVAPLLARHGTAGQHDRWLRAIVSGRLMAALALHEEAGRYDIETAETRAERDAANGGWRLSGTKSGVLAGERAGLFLVSARTSGDARDRHGLSLFAVPADAAGLRVQAHRLIDGRGAAHLHLDAVRVDETQRIGPLDATADALHDALARAEAALCAECAGAADALLQQTVEHLATRRQFGKPLASFQALQHRVADMAIALEQIKSMACVAALATESDDIATRDRQIASAKALTSQLSRRIALDAIQLHGAMGMTDECRASHLAKRLIANGLLFGDASFHLRQLTAS